MDAKKFVETLKIQVVAAAVSAVMSALKEPAGTAPSASDVELSDWFKRQSATDQLRLRHVAKEAAEQATFNVLTLLDRVTAIENSSNAGRLELFYTDGNRNILLNDALSEELHNLFTETSVPDFSIMEKLDPYAVGPAAELKSRLRVGDELDIHHVPRKFSAQQTIPDYDGETAPAIALPKGEHKRVSPNAWDNFLNETESDT